MSIPRVSSLVGVALVLTLSACGPDRARPFREAFEPVAAGYMEELDIPGLAVVVVDRDAVIYRYESGFQSLRDSAPVTGRSLFHVASVTKTFTATAVLRQVERGALDLDDAVIRHLPYFRPDDSPSARITVRQLLSHTSGLSDVRDFGWEEPKYEADALEQFVREAAARPLVAEPGSAFNYSNLGYSVLGALLAAVSGDDFETALRETVLLPAGMSESSALLADVVDAPELTAPHVLDSAYHVGVSDVRPYNREHAPSSTLYTSTQDIAKWLSLHLRRGRPDSDALLSGSMYAEMWSAQPGTDGQMGLGWFLGERGGVNTVFHSGADLGYAAYLLLQPDSGIGVAVFSNYERAPVQVLAELLLDVALGREPGPLPPTAGLQLDRLLYRELNAGGVEGAVRLFRALRSAEAFDFNQVRQLLGLAGVLRDDGRIAGAAAMYGLCIELYPEFSWLHELHAVALRDAGDSTAALTAARRALELNPDAERAKAVVRELGESR